MAHSQQQPLTRPASVCPCSSTLGYNAHNTISIHYEALRSSLGLASYLESRQSHSQNYPSARPSWITSSTASTVSIPSNRIPLQHATLPPMRLLLFFAKHKLFTPTRTTLTVTTARSRIARRRSPPYYQRWRATAVTPYSPLSASWPFSTCAMTCSNCYLCSTTTNN
jgi:hypothetical protein